MKIIPLVAMFVALSQFVQGQNTAEESPISMRQLMDSLRIRGGNWTFNFPSPVFARISCEVSSYPDGKKTEKTVFTSDRASESINLFYTDTPQEFGVIASYKSQHQRMMAFKLSECEETTGTRLLYYKEKFSNQPWIAQDGKTGHYKPAIAAVPELNKEYLLNYYFEEGDPYKVLVTICFVTHLEDLKIVPPVELKSRTFKTTSE